MDSSRSEGNVNGVGDMGINLQGGKSEASSPRLDFLTEFSAKLFGPEDLCGDGQGDRGCVKLRLRNLTEYIDVEEGRLIELEERRRKLESDMERLQHEIEQEKKLYRKAIDEEIDRRQKHGCSCRSSVPPLSPFAITKEVENKLKECREMVFEARCQSARQDESVDINRLKANLVAYRKTMYDTKHNRLAKQKRHAAAKIFQKHLEDIDLKCNEQIDNLNKIQQSIGLNFTGKPSNW